MPPPPNRCQQSIPAGATWASGQTYSTSSRARPPHPWTHQRHLSVGTDPFSSRYANLRHLRHLSAAHHGQHPPDVVAVGGGGVAGGARRRQQRGRLLNAEQCDGRLESDEHRYQKERDVLRGQYRVCRRRGEGADTVTHRSPRAHRHTVTRRSPSHDQATGLALR